MIKIWRKITAFCLAMIMTCSMFGTLAVNGEEATELSGEIEVIFNRNEVDIQPYIEAFENRYPGVTVKYTCYNDLETEIKARMETGDYGDVMYFPSFIPTEEAENYFEPLGDYETLSAKYNYLDQGRVYNNAVYGIPSSAYLIGVVYNKEVFDKAGISTLPTTIEDFLYDMYLIEAHTDAIPFYSGYKEPWVLSYWELFPYIEMTGKASYKYNEFIVDVNPFRKGTVHNQCLGMLYELVESGYTEVGREDLSWWDSVIRLNSGEVACAVIGTWALYDYKNVGENGHNIGFMPFPYNINGEQYVTVCADYSYAIAKNSDNKAVARAFVDFMLDESGYAFNHDTISVLKTDQYPECYGDMTHTTIQNITSATDEAISQYYTLSTNLQLYYQDEYIRLIEAAAGIRNEGFEDVMQDWNARWEASRADWMIKELENGDSDSKNDIVDIEEIVLEFSSNELKYITENPVQRVGYHTCMAPLSFEKDGEFVGLARYICDYIAEKTGLKMMYQGYDSTEELIVALETGEIDLIAGTMKKEASDITYSKEYLEYMDVVVRNNNVEAVNFSKYGYVNSERQIYGEKEMQLIAYSDMNLCLEGVDGLWADFTILNYYSANYYMRKYGYDNLTVMPFANNQTYHIGFPSHINPTMIAICNKCIYTLGEGEAEIILMEYMDEVVMALTLRSFIKAHPIMTVFGITFVFLLLFIILYQRDRTRQKQAIDAKKYKILAAMADEYFFEYSYPKKRFKFDEKFKKAVGVEGSILPDTYDGDNLFVKQFLEQIATAIEQKSDMQSTMTITQENNSKQWYRVITTIVYNDKKQPVHMIGKLVNVQKEMEELANYQDKAHRDALTKLYNREGMMAHLPNEATDVVLAVMDIDDFKQVNDTLGHSGGDYALMYFADKLEQHMGTKSVISRFGGDEFIVLLTGVSEEEAKERLSALVKAMDVSLRYAGNSRKLSISVGAVYAKNMKSFEEMFNQADKVLYKTKEEGKNNYKLEIN